MSLRGWDSESGASKGRHGVRGEEEGEAPAPSVGRCTGLWFLEWSRTSHKCRGTEYPEEVQGLVFGIPVVDESP